MKRGGRWVSAIALFLFAFLLPLVSSFFLASRRSPAPGTTSFRTDSIPRFSPNFCPYFCPYFSYSLSLSTFSPPFAISPEKDLGEKDRDPDKDNERNENIKELSQAKSKYASDNLDAEVQNIMGSYSEDNRINSDKNKRNNQAIAEKRENDRDDSFICFRTENDVPTGEISPKNGKIVTSQVEARVYDISGKYKPMLSAVLGYKVEGIWHIGVRVYNKEYWFSTHIEEMVTHDEETGEALDVTPFGLTARYTYDLGATTLTQEEFETHLYQQCAPRYGINDYHVLKNNCNHFANEIIGHLTDEEKKVPPFVLELTENALRKFNSVHAAITEVVANKIARVVMLAWGKSAKEGGTFDDQG